MFQSLSKQIAQAAHSLSRSQHLTEENTKEAILKVRFALLDADVNFQVVKKFIAAIKDEVISGKHAVVKGSNAGDTFIQVVHGQLISLLENPSHHSDSEQKIHTLSASLEDIEAPIQESIKVLGLKHRELSAILFCGLQASGKTTQVAKLAAWINKKFPEKKVLVAACDLQRPKAREQLAILCDSVNITCHRGEGSALDAAYAAFKRARAESYDLVIIDTAGRLYLDDTLMQEIKRIKELSKQQAEGRVSTVFVASAAMGQDVAKSASAFNDSLGVDGAIITMLDGDARAGGVLSICSLTGKPILFEGVGEKITDLQPFNPRSMADRILGMGDTINLMRKLSEQVSEDDAKKMSQKILSSGFTYSDYLSQMQMVSKMGSLSSLMQMVPGMNQLPIKDSIDEKGFKKTEAMILSMTSSERQGHDELTPSRRRRIAKGSGVHLHDLNRMIKAFDQAKKMFKSFSGGAGNFGNISKILKKNPFAARRKLR